MPRQQMFRLGRTLTAVNFVLWFINNWLNSFPINTAIIVIGLAALILIWKGWSE
jgi:hypothetical protein